MTDAEILRNSMAAAKQKPAATPISAPRPGSPANVAASISPARRPAALKQPQPIEDDFDYAVAFKLSFLGTGQGGGRIANSFRRLGYRRVAAFNTTASDFEGLDEDMPKLSLDVGGAGKDMAQAQAALRGREEEVRDLLMRAWGATTDYALICASLGGGTGSGLAPKAVELARRYMKDHGLTPRVGAIVSLPTVTEGFQVCRNAVNGFNQLRDLGVSPLIVIDNGRINQLYNPPMAQLNATANDTVAQMLHLFSQLASVHSPYVTFDRAELGQILDSGLVVMGAAEIDKIDSPSDISAAVRDQLTGNVLAQVDLTTGRKGACIFVANQSVLDTLSKEFFEAGYAQMDRILGGGEDNVPTVVHRGLYAGTDPGLQCYAMIGDLQIPTAKLHELAVKGGLGGMTSRSRLADHFGINDGGSK
jgi:cell division GTPase FtsZ